MHSNDPTRQIDELKALRSQLRAWRLGIPVVALLILGTFVWSLYSAASSLAREGPTQDAFMAEFTKGLNSEVVPIVQKVAQQTFLDTKTAVQHELAVLNDRTPEMAGLLKAEIEILVNSVPNKGEKILSDSFGKMLKRREAEIRKMYPTVTEARVASLLVSITDLAHSQIDQVTHQIFNPHLDALSSILDDVDHIRRTETTAGTEELASWDMAMLIFDLIREEFGELHVKEIEVTAPVKKSAKP